MTITRDAGAKYFIPSENEWYKAAYYDPTLNAGAGGYWLYPTRSNTAPSNILSLTGTNNANFPNPNLTDLWNFLTPVGYFAGSPGPFGTYDMGGDLWQWTETAFNSESCFTEGGSRADGGQNLSSPYRNYYAPAYSNSEIGFRVASSVPEPGSVALLLAGGVCLVVFAWRRRRQAA